MAKRKTKIETGLTPHKNGDFIEFIDDADRQKFISCVVDALKDIDNQKKIREKEAKCKSSFKMNIEIPDFVSLGIDPKLVFKFKKVKNSDEWDLDIEMKKKDSATIEEYFDVTPQEEKKNKRKRTRK